MRKMRNAGFTLLELIVVLLLISLVAALIFPRLPSTREADLRNSARQMSVLLRYLEERAVAVKMVYRLRINLDDGRITVTQRTATGGEQPPDDPFLRRIPLAEGIRISDITSDQLGRITTGEALINYGPGGRREALLLHLVSSDGRYFTIQALPVNASIKVAAGYLEELP